MTFRNAQIGWGTKAKLLQQITKKLSMLNDRLCCPTTTITTTVAVTSTTSTTEEVPL